MMLINKRTGEVQDQSHRDKNWLGEDWVEVPEELIAQVLQFAGCCTFVIEGDELVGVEPLPLPELEPQEPTEAERLRADVDFIAAMAGVTL